MRCVWLMVQQQSWIQACVPLSNPWAHAQSAFGRERGRGKAGSACQQASEKKGPRGFGQWNARLYFFWTKLAGDNEMPVLKLLGEFLESCAVVVRWVAIDFRLCLICPMIILLEILFSTEPPSLVEPSSRWDVLLVREKTREGLVGGI